MWIYFRLPEPKDRTYGELDVLFEQRVSARKFASTKVDPYRTRGMGVEVQDGVVRGEEKEAKNKTEKMADVEKME